MQFLKLEMQNKLKSKKKGIFMHKNYTIKEEKEPIKDTETGCTTWYFTVQIEQAEN